MKSESKAVMLPVALIGSGCLIPWLDQMSSSCLGRCLIGRGQLDQVT